MSTAIADARKAAIAASTALGFSASPGRSHRAAMSISVTATSSISTRATRKPARRRERKRRARSAPLFIRCHSRKDRQRLPPLALPCIRACKSRLPSPGMARCTSGAGDRAGALPRTSYRRRCMRAAQVRASRPRAPRKFASRSGAGPPAPAPSGKAGSGASAQAPPLPRNRRMRKTNPLFSGTFRHRHFAALILPCVSSPYRAPVMAGCRKGIGAPAKSRRPGKKIPD